MGTKLFFYWKLINENIISHNVCLFEKILGKCGSLIIPLLVLKENVCAFKRIVLTLSNQNCTSNPEVMSNIFNTYFVSMGQQLASKISPLAHHAYPVKSHLCCMIIKLRM